jgi:asparagine synthase (glutamine-hydrolysing)
MPGMNLIFNRNEKFIIESNNVIKAINSLQIHEDIENLTFMEKDRAYIGATVHASYPIITFEDDYFFILIEGKIYDQELDNVKKKIIELVFPLFSELKNGKNDFSGLQRWLLSIDGDFIFTVLHKKTLDLIILNDVLGRLPLYYSVIDNNIIISRHIKFITTVTSNTILDLMGVSLFLSFGYTAGKRTLVDNVSYLEPGSLIYLNHQDFRLSLYDIHKFNFEIKEDRRDMKETARTLAKLFTEGSISRTGDDKSVLGLSGGLDSRAVAASLKKGGADFSAVTRISYEQNEKVDADIAAKIAEALTLPWHLIDSPAPKGKHYSQLIKMKSGLNSLSASFLLPYFVQLKDNFGNNITYFTGDGGDRVKPTLKPLKKIGSLSDLVDYILTANSVLSSEQIEKITNVSRQELSVELKDTLSSYPEKNLYQKFVHFMVYESALKWVFEGEDRNRFYFWSVTPFYSLHFFNYAMKCPDGLKQGYRLYHYFLKELSSELIDIKNASWNLPISSKKVKYYLFAYYFYKNMPVVFKKIVKKNYKTTRNKPLSFDGNLITIFEEIVMRCSALKTQLNLKEITEIAKSSKKGFYNTLTIISLLEDINFDENSFLKNANAQIK